MSPWQIIAEALGQRLDAELIPSLYAAASVAPAQARDELRAAGLAFVDEATGQFPEPDDIARTVAWVVKAASRQAGVVGAVSGAAGFLAVAPEVLASAVATLRLAQRLAVVYGFDPDTDAGRMVISRALAHAYEVQLPESTRVATRVSELPALVRTGAGNSQAMVAWAGRRALSGTASVLVGRVSRLVPGLGAVIGGIRAFRAQERLAARMCEVYARTMEALPFDLRDEEIAVEVR